MKYQKRLISSAFALALAGQVQMLHAQSMAEPLDSSMVDVMENGFFALPSMEPNLVVMNVRVFNDDNKLVFSDQALEHSVQLLATELPDGIYRYEVVSVFALAEPVGEGADLEEYSTQRNFGTFTVKAGAIEVPYVGEHHDVGDDGFSLLDRLSEGVWVAANWTLSLLVSDAHAQNITVDSTTPRITFDDTNEAGSTVDFQVETHVESDDSSGWFRIEDWVNGKIGGNLFILNTTGSTSNNDSIVVDADGDIHWANGGLNFDRGNQSLGIGGNSGEDENIVIFDSTPDIRLHDTGGTSEAEWQLNGSEVTFWGRPSNPGSWNNPITYNVNSPDDSLVIDSAGNVGVGLVSPARQFHMRGSNAVFRMDRSANTASFMLVRTNGSFTPWKTYVVGTNASGSNNGEFVINDLGNAVSGPGNNRMTINNSGNVHFPGIVTASNIAAPSSRALKENIVQITDPLDLTLRLEGVRFDWKESGQPALGFIAEDLEKVLPEVVLHDEGTGEMLGVNYTAVVPVLVEAIKTQQQEIEALKAELASFQDQESRLARLEELVVGASLQETLAHN